MAQPGRNVWKPLLKVGNYLFKDLKSLNGVTFTTPEAAVASLMEIHKISTETVENPVIEFGLNSNAGDPDLRYANDWKFSPTRPDQREVKIYYTDASGRIENHRVSIKLKCEIGTYGIDDYSADSPSPGGMTYSLIVNKSEQPKFSTL